MIKKDSAAAESSRTSSSTTIRFASLVLVLVTIVALAAIAYFTEREIVVRRDWVIHTYQVRSQLSALQVDILHARLNETTYLLERQQEQLADLREESDLAHHTVGVLRKLTADNPRQQQSLDQLDEMFNGYATLGARLPSTTGIEVELSATQRRNLADLESRARQIGELVRGMEVEEESLLEQRVQSWDHLFKRNVLMLGLAFAVVTMLLAYNFRRLVTEVALTKEIEKQARETAASYRAMSARILELQDAERRRIARELHDSVGQYLAGLKINLNQLEVGASVAPLQMIRESIGLIDCAIQEVRTISHLLHPPLLEELGFLSAARWYVDEFGKRSQVKVSLVVDEPVERLPREIEIALFRVLQESLTNVYRHASASSVDVRIACRDGLVTLSVADDGKGIPDEVLTKFRAGAAPGIGLAGMRERLVEFGGEIRVEASERGSFVMAVIPTAGCAIGQAGAATVG